tara:strand:- start:652 stop:1893 length:1242 start_codon:yes stop_codon:yes gene_type:complete
MKNKQFLQLLTLFLTLLLVTTTVTALGISPGRIQADFTPGLEVTKKLTIYNTEHKDKDIILYAEGDLGEYIKLSETQFHFTAEESEKEITYTVRLPNHLGAPGTHRGRIVARELGTKQEGEIVVQALVAVASAFDVQVPYPGKYLTTQFYVATTKAQEPIPLLVQAHNLGTQDIIHAKTIITITDNKEKIVTTIESDETLIKARKRVELLSYWETNLSYGQYTAHATTHYDGAKTETTKQRFQIGEFILEPIDISVKNFKLGEVAKFNILVKNKAEQKIEKALAQILFHDKEEKNIADFTSADTTINTLATKALLAYWDTENIEQGTYEGKLILRADEATSENRLRTTITEEEIITELLDITGKSISTQITSAKVLSKQASIALLTIVIILGNVIGWFVYFKRKDKGKIMDNF